MIASKKKTTKISSLQWISCINVLLCYLAIPSIVFGLVLLWTCGVNAPKTTMSLAVSNCQNCWEAVPTRTPLNVRSSSALITDYKFTVLPHTCLLLLDILCEYPVGFINLANVLSFHCANTFLTVNLIGRLATPLWFE